MIEPINIAADWGGTIFRDERLYNLIAEKSGNFSVNFHPEDWAGIREIGNENYFDSIKGSFLGMAQPYPSAFETLSKLCWKSNKCDTKVFVLYDNNPKLEMPVDEIVKRMAIVFQKNKCDVNGFYVEPDKIKFGKQNNIDIFIEDDPRIAFALASFDFKVIMMPRRHNLPFNIDAIQLLTTRFKFSKIYDNILVAEDWEEVNDIIQKIISPVKR
jgi:hypothetical protein